ncbi:hypothetical protein QBC35DRAFT_450481 [Podospora australis]|uniref:Uncharacterized protein n=1 Tax=Podospora australis TaxID=1536484 RepID=A0AAN6WWC5_9PEZI|nr:hypothetical protein QBC35DRAFT_450481 [Podospora australis]
MSAPSEMPGSPSTEDVHKHLPAAHLTNHGELPGLAPEWNPHINMVPPFQRQQGGIPRQHDAYRTDAEHQSLVHEALNLQRNLDHAYSVLQRHEVEMGNVATAFTNLLLQLCGEVDDMRGGYRSDRCPCHPTTPLADVWEVNLTPAHWNYDHGQLVSQSVTFLGQLVASWYVSLKAVEDQTRCASPLTAVQRAVFHLGPVGLSKAKPLHRQNKLQPSQPIDCSMQPISPGKHAVGPLDRFHAPLRSSPRYRPFWPPHAFGRFPTATWIEDDQAKPPAGDVRIRVRRRESRHLGEMLGAWSWTLVHEPHPRANIKK